MPHSSRSKALIAGIGSPYGSDRLGWQAVDLLGQAQWTQRHPGWQWQSATLDRPGPVLLDYLRGMELAILVDALQIDGDAPHLLTLDALLSDAAPLSGHGLGLAETLQLGYQLDMLPAHLLVVGLPMNMSLDADTLSEWLDRRLAAFTL